MLNCWVETKVFHAGGLCPTGVSRQMVQYSVGAKEVSRMQVEGQGRVFFLGN